MVLIGSLVLSFIYGGMALAYLLSGHPLSAWDGVGSLAAVLAVVVAVGMICWSVFRLILGKPFLILDKEGFHTRETGRISWSDVENVALIYSSRYSFGFAERISISLTSSEVIEINVSLLSVNTKKVLELFNAYRGTLWAGS